MRVLHIEDDQQVVRAMERMLRINYDATVITKDTASGAIQCLMDACADPALGFDLIVSDYDLANGSNAGEVVTWLRANDPDMLDWFVFLCGNDACKAHGLPWLEKPASMTAVRRVIEEMRADLNRPYQVKEEASNAT